jgi:hypothetical protein
MVMRDKKLEAQIEQQKRSNRWIYWIAGTPILVAAILSFYFFYSILAPVKILEIRKTPSIVQPSEIVAGDTIEIQVDYCKHKLIFADLKIIFNGPVVVQSLQSQTKLDVGCHTNGRIPIVTPATLPSGQWSVTMRFEYQVNGFRREVIDVQTEKFFVQENPAVKRLLQRASNSNI